MALNLDSAIISVTRSFEQNSFLIIHVDVGRVQLRREIRSTAFPTAVTIVSTAFLSLLLYDVIVTLLYL